MINVTVECKRDNGKPEEFQEIEFRNGRVASEEIEGYYEDAKTGSYIELKSGIEWHVKESLLEIDALLEKEKSGLLSLLNN